MDQVFLDIVGLEFPVSAVIPVLMVRQVNPVSAVIPVLMDRRVYPVSAVIPVILLLVFRVIAHQFKVHLVSQVYLVSVVFPALVHPVSAVIQD